MVSGWLPAMGAAALLWVIMTYLIPSHRLVSNTTQKHFKDSSNNTIANKVATENQPEISSKEKSDSLIAFKRLFTKFFKKDTLPDKFPAALATALFKYMDDDYAEIENLNLNKLSLSRGGDFLDDQEHVLLYGHYYKGISYLVTNDNNKAIINLKWVAEHSKDLKMKIKGRWYLALAYTREGKKDNALEILRKLKSRDAEELLYHIQNEL